jgi:hypothetical protein
MREPAPNRAAKLFVDEGAMFSSRADGGRRPRFSWPLRLIKAAGPDVGSLAIPLVLNECSVSSKVIESFVNGLQGDVKVAGELFRCIRIRTIDGFVDHGGADAPAFEKHLPIV